MKQKDKQENLNKVNIMKTLQIIFIFLYSANVLAIDHGFNYQGVLKENGVPANGLYDFTVKAYMNAESELDIGRLSVHNSIEVIDGIFHLADVYLHDYNDPTLINPFKNQDQLYIEINVRPAGVGSFERLFERQELRAVPFAYNLAAKGAFQGDVLTFDGEEWNPVTPGDEKWVNTSPGITYGENVGIGTNPPSVGGSKLTVQSAGSTGLALELRGYTPDGGAGVGPRLNFTNSQNYLRENSNIMRFKGHAGIEIQTNTGDLEISTEEVHISGGVAIGHDNPRTGAGLHIINDSSSEAIPLLVTTPSGDDVLTVKNHSLAFSKPIRQPNDVGGAVKYLLNLRCADDNSSVINFFNGVLTTSSSGFDVSNGATEGSCTVKFPSDISNRFFQVSARFSLTGRNATCNFGLNDDELSCVRFNTTDGTGVDGDIMIAIF